jgi:hypothetical protein
LLVLRLNRFDKAERVCGAVNDNALVAGWCLVGERSLDPGPMVAERGLAQGEVAE